MTLLNKLTAFIIIGISLISCNEVPLELPQKGNIESDRVVLLQEFTGVKCPNCPKGAAEAKRLLNEYGDNLVVMAIHGDFLTDPLPESLYDFRTDDSREIEDASPFQGKPAGAINRRKLDPVFLAYDTDFWDEYIVDELSLPATMNVLVEATYDESSNAITVDVFVKPLETLMGGYTISVGITQGGIIDAQEDGSVILDEYEHDHVLRKMLTNPLGDILASDLIKDVQLKRTYTYTIPTDDLAYDIPNLEIVAYVSRDGAAESPIIQAAKTHIN